MPEYTKPWGIKIDKWMQIMPVTKPLDSKMVEKQVELRLKIHTRRKNIIGPNLDTDLSNSVDYYAGDDDVIFVDDNTLIK